MTEKLEFNQRKSRRSGGGKEEAPNGARADATLFAQVSPHIKASVDRSSPIFRQYRNLSRSVCGAEWEEAPESILVASASSGDGRSVTALNLAIALASLSKRQVVVVDADFRNPSQHALTGLEVEPGLAEHLGGELALDDVVQESSIPGISLVSAGLASGNPTELLSRTAFRDCIRRLAARFDQVVIDSPALDGFSDAAVMAPHVEGVVLAVRIGETDRKSLAQAKFLLGRVNSRILGAVLTHATPSRS